MPVFLGVTRHDPPVQRRVVEQVLSCEAKPGRKFRNSVVQWRPDSELCHKPLLSMPGRDDTWHPPRRKGRCHSWNRPGKRDECAVRQAGSCEPLLRA